MFIVRDPEGDVVHLAGTSYVRILCASEVETNKCLEFLYHE